MTHDAFREAIAETPEDDTPRLVYADWLEDHRQPERAAFIRAQCQLAKSAADDARRPELRKREQELLGRQGTAWRNALPKLPGVTWDRTFRRGFVEGALVEGAGTFLAQAGRLFRAAPLRSLELRKVRGVKGLAASPWLRRLRRLCIRNCHVGPAGAAALARSPHLAGLTVLVLSGTDVGAEGAEALVGSPHLTRLSALDLAGNDLFDGGADVIAQAPSLASLEALDLELNHIGDEGARALARSRCLARLEVLNLYGNHIGDTGARALARSKPLSGLRTLDLEMNQIGDPGGRAFLAAAGRAPKRAVNLFDNAMSEEIEDHCLDRWDEDEVSYGHSFL
jgi:uncharacterized protein (TIGR02996 family)